MPSHLKRPLVRALLGALLALACSCSQPEEETVDSALQSIDGHVFLKEAFELPEDATLSVILADVSKADAPYGIVSKTQHSISGQPPYPFSVKYYPHTLEERNRYALIARIESSGTLLFKNATSTPALDSSSPEILMDFVGKPDAPIVNTRWKVIAIGTQPIEIGDSGKELHLTLFGQDNRVSGFSGCNNITGSYSIENDSIQFSEMASTRKACIPAAMDQESRFLEALRETVRYAIDGDSLDLLDANGTTLISFEALYLQ